MEPWGKLRNFFKKFHRATREFEEKEFDFGKQIDKLKTLIDEII